MIRDPPQTHGIRTLQGQKSVHLIRRGVWIRMFLKELFAMEGFRIFKKCIHHDTLDKQNVCSLTAVGSKELDTWVAQSVNHLTWPQLRSWSHEFWVQALHWLHAACGAYFKKGGGQGTRCTQSSVTKAEKTKRQKLGEPCFRAQYHLCKINMNTSS